MPVFMLQDDISFPPPDLSDPDGLLAMGGDLSVNRLLLAYKMGIFPWFEDGQPILWWSPDPRLVIYPGTLKISRSLRQTMNKGIYEISFDTSFKDVIALCAEVNSIKHGSTWISQEMIDAYVALHEKGHAHSVECRKNGLLCGGLYGVSIGAAFFGESMFSTKPDASKTALAALDAKLSLLGFEIIDCQVFTAHLKNMGAIEINRTEFLSRLSKAVSRNLSPGAWKD